MEEAVSVNGVPIRLPAERWTHIVESHSELAGRIEDVLDAVSAPEWVTAGYRGALMAWRALGRGRFLAVIYREVSMSDGFVVTALITRSPRREPKVWPRD
jgi:hypothetical protein